MYKNDFFYQELFPLSEDQTEYYLLTDKYVSTIKVEDKDILKIEPEALTLLSQQAFHDASFFFVLLINSKLLLFCMILKRAKTINMSRFSYYVMLRSQLEVSCLIVRIRAHRLLWPKKANEFGLIVMIHKPYLVASITPSVTITCAIRKMRR